jgi:hypothetical protein
MMCSIGGGNMKTKVLLCLAILLVFGASTMSAQTNDSAVLNAVKSALDTGTVKTVWVGIGGNNTILGMAQIATVNYSQFPLLVLDDPKSGLKGIVDISRIAGYMLTKGILYIYLE